MASGDIVLTGTINTSSSNDVYPTHSANTGKGGYRSVADVAARDSIPTQRREHGMIVYVQNEDKKYILGAGLTNSDWFEDSSSSEESSNNLKWIMHMSEMPAEVPSDLADGGLLIIGDSQEGEVIHDGYTFTPHVDEETGVLSWTNDMPGNASNPNPIILALIRDLKDESLVAKYNDNDVYEKVIETSSEYDVSSLGITKLLDIKGFSGSSGNFHKVDVEIVNNKIVVTENTVITLRYVK